MDRKTRMLLLRHGEVANIKEWIYNGHNDVDLSEDGVKQYETIAERLKDVPIKAVYSSDLLRASRGGEMIAAKHGLSVIKCSELRELHYGIWEGQTVSHIRKTYAEEVKQRYADIANYRVEGGETLVELAARVLPKIEALLMAHLGETILVVAHGGVNRIILLDILNSSLQNFYSLQQSFGGLNIIDYYETGHKQIELANSTIYKERFWE